MIDSLLLGMTGTPPPAPTIPGIDLMWPWGASASDEMIAFAFWDLGRRWINAHYDEEKRQYIDALQVD